MKKIKKMSLFLATIIILSTLVCLSIQVPTSVAEASEETEDDDSQKATITMPGSARTPFAPDLGSVYLRIETKAWSANDAKNENSRISNDVINALLAIGIDEDDIETQNFRINPEYEWENRKSVFKGYKVVNTIRVKTMDFEKIGKIIDVSVAKGALVDSINFELSSEKLNEYKAQVMADATLDAKNKAEAVADALGMKLGDLVSVSASSTGYTPYPVYRSNLMMDAGYAEASVPTNIQPKDLDVSASLTIVWELI